MDLTTVQPWYADWAWVAGYSSLATMVIIFNFLLIISVASNRFLHYSFYYVVIALSLRNLLRVSLTLCLVLLSKLVQTPELLDKTYLLPANMSTTDIDLSQAANMPMTCKLLNTSDHLLMTSLMFYLAGLSVYMFSRHPNPPISSSNSETMLKFHKIGQVKERFWVAPLLILFPPLMSALLCLPVLLLEETHPMVALPGGSLCNIPHVLQYSTYQFSIAIIGFYLPAAIGIFLLIGLSIRRCISCCSGICVSSFCKEEIVLALLTLPYIPSYLAMYLPLLDNYLSKLDAPQSNLQDYLTPERARAVEMGLGLLLPMLVFALLQPCRRLSTAPVGRKVRNSQQPTAPDNRLSQASFDLDLSHRNSYYQH